MLRSKASESIILKVLRINGARGTETALTIAGSIKLHRDRDMLKTKEIGKHRTVYTYGSKLRSACICLLGPTRDHDISSCSVAISQSKNQ